MSHELPDEINMKACTYSESLETALKANRRRWPMRWVVTTPLTRNEAMDLDAYLNKTTGIIPLGPEDTLQMFPAKPHFHFSNGLWWCNDWESSAFGSDTVKGAWSNYIWNKRAEQFNQAELRQLASFPTEEEREAFVRDRIGEPFVIDDKTDHCVPHNSCGDGRVGNNRHKPIRRK